MIREFYIENESFKILIDKISPEDFIRIFSFISEISIRNGVDLELHDIAIEKLFDTDLCVTIQNLIQALTRLEISKNFFENV